MSEPDSGVHFIRTGWRGGSADFPIDVEVVHFPSLIGDWDVEAIVAEGGQPGYRFKQRGVYPDGDGTWGCAICEQTHPLEVPTCPLVGKRTVRVAIGPFRHDDGETLYVTCEAAEGSFVSGRMVRGVGVFALPATDGAET